MSELESPLASLEAGPMSRVDLAWLRMDEPTNLMVITGVMVFAERLEREALARVLEKRLLPIARFRQKVVRTPRGALWEDVDNLDMGQHLQTVTLDKADDEEALKDLVGKLMSSPLDPDRPLWAVDLIEDYKGGSVLISRLHHAIADGVALMLVLLSLTELEEGLDPEANGEESANPLAAVLHQGAAAGPERLEAAGAVLPEVMGLMTRSSKGLRASKTKIALKASSALGKLTFRSADPKTRFKGPLSLEKRVSWSRSLPLEQVRALKDSLGGTLNDVLLTAVTGGLRRYLLARGDTVEGLDIRAAVPVSLRPLERLSTLGNHFGLVFLALPVGIADPKDRLAVLRQRMQELKGSYEAGMVLGMLRGMGLTPQQIQDLVMRIFGTKATAVMTNVPGPRQPLYLAGRTIQDILFWVPQAGRLGMGISIFSYAGSVRVGVTTDQGLVPDPEAIVEGFHQELASFEAS